MGLCEIRTAAVADPSGNVGVMMENYFKDMKAKLLERENTTLQELAILDSAMNEVLTAKIPETDKVKLAKFVSGMQERDRSRLKILSERKELVSRILEVFTDV